MENYNNINDKDLNRLLKQRLLEQEDDALLEAEAKLVFSSTLVIVPDIKKEEAFLKKLKKPTGGFWKWLFKGISVVIGTAALLYAYQQLTRHTAQEMIVKEQPLVSETGNADRLQNEGESRGVNYNEIPGKLTEQQLSSLISNEQKSVIKENDNNSINSLRASYLGIYKGQLIGNAEKKNGDCSSPITIKDSIIVLVNSPLGYGNSLEISGNAPDDELYFEKEHNTVWYKFSVKKDCKLALDITPINEANNFDFMLFQYNGPNFPAQIKTRKILPIRTCISESDKSPGNKTGLQYDEQAPTFVHSEQGPSYVKYVDARKGQIFYLLVDGTSLKNNGKNVYDGQRGYTIRFHYKEKEYNPDELYVGKSVLAANIYFVPDRPEFLPNSGYETAIDSIYYFLKGHPKISVEIQGHVNSIELQKQNGKKTYSQELSERRAKAVFTCLVAKGIDPRRILPVGYAGARKKILHPKTIPESSKNVRVDIVVLSMDFEADEKLGLNNN
jgi:outer membrane protein OmpA-like peptidoglycan-associated protein